MRRSEVPLVRLLTLAPLSKAKKIAITLYSPRPANASVSGRAGHELVFSDHGTDSLLSHPCEATNGGPFLRISTIVWEHGWPRVAKLPRGQVS